MNKQYHKRFDAIINPVQIAGENNIIEKGDVELDEKKLQERQSIPAEVVQQLLEKLAVFEKHKGFLEKTISIQKVALQLNTNTKYLSKIINAEKGKTFVSYINDLRIAYAVEQLQVQSKLRNYTMLSLANEFGFNTAESFSDAFYKKTKIKPTYFAKELDNQIMK
jgi:AraC-like DNA-binding protein